MSVRELSALRDEYGEFKVPVIYDMGSGLMADLSGCGIAEPTVAEALKEPFYYPMRRAGSRQVSPPLILMRKTLCCLRPVVMIRSSVSRRIE